MALSDTDVDRQIRQMRAFIEQEASEKADEIEAKAEEEFNIEKGRLVQMERVKIMEFYEKKEKQIEMQKRIQQSHQKNSSKLKQFAAQNQCIESLVEDAKKHLLSLTGNIERYTPILKNLITQGCVKLIEDKVVISCRKEDVQLVQSLLGEVQADYGKVTGRKVQFKIDPNHLTSFDPSHPTKGVTGGVRLCREGGAISVDNTLDARLQLSLEENKPALKKVLFPGIIKKN